MPRVLVTTDDSSHQVLLDETVNAGHLDTKHSAGQLIERLAWGIQDAVIAERVFKEALAPRSYREVGD
jgi:hypothetical protein